MSKEDLGEIDFGAVLDGDLEEEISQNESPSTGGEENTQAIAEALGVTEEEPVEEEDPSGTPDLKGKTKESTEDDESAGSDQKQKVVPHQALHAEREKRKQVSSENSELRAELEQLRQSNTQIRQMMMNLSQGQQYADVKAQQEQEQQRRAQEEELAKKDPLRAVMEKMNRFEQTEQEKAQYQQEQQQLAQFDNHYVTDMRSNIQQNPAIGKAYEMVRKFWKQSAEMTGATDQDIDKHERQFAQVAYQRGISPARAYLELATGMGFDPTTAAEQQIADAGAEQQLQNLENGMKRSASFSKAGSTSTGRLSVEDIAAMDDNDFARLSEEDFRRAMGG
jgi:hypothetical protein